MEATKRKELWNQCKNWFLVYYQEQTGLPYIFGAKEGVALSSIVVKLGNIAGSHDVLDLFKMLITRTRTINSWYVQNWSLPTINSKFNEITNTLKNEKRDKSTPTTPTDRIAKAQRFTWDSEGSKGQ